MDKQILNQREQKNNYLRTNSNSPIPKWARKKFKGLVYFEFNNDLIFKSIIKKRTPFQEIIIKDNFGQIQEYAAFADLNFSYKQTHYQLCVYRHQLNKDVYWLPFNDKTNGFETYNGGRYIKITEEDLNQNFFILNFNTAYNPFCAYNNNFACPIIPKENNLKLEINAGEKFAQQLW